MYTLYNFDSVEENQQEIIEVLYKFHTRFKDTFTGNPDTTKGYSARIRSDRTKDPCPAFDLYRFGDTIMVPTRSVHGYSVLVRNDFANDRRSLGQAGAGISGQPGAWNDPLGCSVLLSAAAIFRV